MTQSRRMNPLPQLSPNFSAAGSSNASSEPTSMKDQKLAKPTSHVYCSGAYTKKMPINKGAFMLTAASTTNKTNRPGFLLLPEEDGGESSSSSSSSSSSCSSLELMKLELKRSPIGSSSFLLSAFVAASSSSSTTTNNDDSQRTNPAKSSLSFPRRSPEKSFQGCWPTPLPLPQRTTDDFGGGGVSDSGSSYASYWAKNATLNNQNLLLSDEELLNPTQVAHMSHPKSKSLDDNVFNAFDLCY